MTKLQWNNHQSFGVGGHNLWLWEWIKMFGQTLYGWAVSRSDFNLTQYTVNALVSEIR